jgi:hypothetical protein
MDFVSVPLLASHLQRLKAPGVKAEVTKAVTNKDVNAFEAACIKAKIPSKMINRITRIVFSVEPDQGWPPLLWW